MRIALVHDWLTTYAGAEKVLEQLLLLYPEADLFAVVDFLSPSARARLLNKRAKTTFIQKFPFAHRLYRHYLPFMPLAIEQLDLSPYDLILSSSHAVAKGVLIGPDQLHICYCHSPLRYAWDMQSLYLKGKKSVLTRYLLHRLRLWDVRSAHGVDHFIANSHFIARRIEKCYRREAVVVYPPVDVESFPLREKKESFYLTVSRLVSYKNVALIVDAFRHLPDRRLVVIGEGPERKKMQNRAPPNVSFLGHVSHEILADYMGRARAFLFAAIEDFGIAPLEAQACGTPVIAYHKGGICESIQETGCFFHELNPHALAETVASFEQVTPPPAEACRKNAKRFSVDRFRREFIDTIKRVT